MFMRTGLALSGGGIRGVAHIGAIKAFKEFGVRPSVISGTSAGAVVGALYAAGHGWKGMLDFFRAVQPFSITKYARNKPGFIDTDKFYDQFKKYLPADSFESLEIPLYVTATDLLTGTLRVFHKGELIRPLLASAAIPGIFAPMAFDGGYYVDGGVLNNFPVDLLHRRCRHIIGVYVNPFEKVPLEELKHSYSVMERAFKIRMLQDSRTKFKNCDLTIVPKGLNNYKAFALRDIDTIFDLGYRASIEVLKSESGPLMAGKTLADYELG